MSLPSGRQSRRPFAFIRPPLPLTILKPMDRPNVPIKLSKHIYDTSALIDKMTGRTGFPSQSSVSITQHLLLPSCPRFSPGKVFTAPSKVPTADTYVALLEEVQLALGESLQHSKEVQSKSHDSHSRPSPIYAPNNLVWLSRRYIPSTRPSNKLDYRRIGPFRVDRMIGKNAV